MNLLSNDRTFARSIDIDEKFPNGVRHHSRSFHEELMSEAGHPAVLRVWEGRLPCAPGLQTGRHAKRVAAPPEGYKLFEVAIIAG